MSNDQAIQSPTAVISDKVSTQINSISQSYGRENLEEALKEYHEASEDKILFRKEELMKICKRL